MVNTPWGNYPDDAHVKIKIHGRDYTFLIDTGSQITILDGGTPYLLITFFFQIILRRLIL